MNVTTFNPNANLSDTGEGLGLDERRIQELSSQDVQASGAQVRLYAGRVVRGELQGARVIMKVYPQVRYLEIQTQEWSRKSQITGPHHEGVPTGALSIDTHPRVLQKGPEYPVRFIMMMLTMSGSRFGGWYYDQWWTETI